MRTRIPKSGFVLGLTGLLAAGAALCLWKQHGTRAEGPWSKETVTRQEPTEPAVLTSAAGQAGPLANTDFRLPREAEAVTNDLRRQAVERLARETPGVSVEFDEITGAPRWVGAYTRFLTPPKSDPGAVDLPVRQFIDSHRDLFGHDSAVLNQARRLTDDTGKDGASKLVWHQQVDGIDIFEAVLQANLTADHALINVGSLLLPDPEAAAGGVERAALIEQPPVSAAQAVAVAGRNVGERVTVGSVRPAGEPAGQPDRRQTFRAAMLTDAEARLAWVPVGPATLRLAWDVTISSRTRAEMYRLLVDAVTGDVLVRHSLTAYLSEASYRVFTRESPTPFAPGHETPSSLQPAVVGRSLVTTSAFNTMASPAGWLPDGVTITSGNNADAYTDSNSDNAPDLPRVQAANRVFDFPLDLGKAPAAYKEASVTQLFYWTNFAHDRLYELGFTEAAGNFQISNFGRGGAANDPVNAEAQDGAGTNNANFSSPADGSRGRMQMYLWTDPAIARDGALDAEVVLHEYCHGLSNRLVGGPTVTISALSTQGLGEGWSDFYSLALTADATDDPHGNCARAGYSKYKAAGWLSENYYFGTRRYSYSTDFLKNPHTFKDIDPKKVDWHADVPRNPTFAATQDATQVHHQGAVWCAMLWEIRANLILKHGFNVGNERAMFLVTQGMKLCPSNPNFVQARDGILQATLVHHAEDLGEVWTGFAKRGLGNGAVAPASKTTTGIAESFSVPDALEVEDIRGWNIQGDAGGVFTPARKTLTLRNKSGSPLNWSAKAGASWLSASPAGGTLAPGAAAVVVLTTHADNAKPGFHSTNLVFANNNTGFNQPVGVRLTVTPPVARVFPLDTDPGWGRTGQWAFGTPTGGGGSKTTFPDPASGATGGSVFGVNLAGNHSTAVGGPYYLTLGPLNLSDLKQTRLRFMRWLNTNAATKTRVTVEVSNDGSLWHEVFVNQGLAITDNSWNQVLYDISPVADRQSAVFLRWSYRNLAAPGAFSGWNIDDIEILGEPTAKLSLDLAGSVLESSGPVAGKLTLGIPPSHPLTVTLTSSDPTAATVPATVTFAPGEVSKDLLLTPVNDPDVDGTQIAVITAAAPEIISSSATVAVMDDEVAVLTLSLPATVTEGSLVPGNLSVDRAPVRDLAVVMLSSHEALRPPATVMIPAGVTGPVPFVCEAPENPMVDGPRQAVLTATVTGWSAASGSIVIADNDMPSVSLSGPSHVREGDPAQVFTVALNVTSTANRVVKLTSSAPAQLKAPASVTIPAGKLGAAVSVTVVNDTVIDGTQNATLTGALAGYGDAAHQVMVIDNEVSHYTFAPISPTQRIKKTIPVVVTARDVEGAAILNHSGAVKLKSASRNGAVRFTQTKMTAFSQGVATASVTVAVSADEMTLEASDSRARKGLSNAFDVTPGVHESFVWSGMPAKALREDTLFNAKVTALDDGGNIATNYTAPTDIEACVPIPGPIVGAADSTAVTAKVYNTAAHDSRAQFIYTAAELGGEPLWIGALKLHVAAPGGQVMKAFTVRLKQTHLRSLEGCTWDNDDWTTVYTASNAAATTANLILTHPFWHDGVRNLMVDISFNNPVATRAGELRCMTAPEKRLLFGTSDSMHGSPLAWTESTGPVPETSADVPVVEVFVVRSIGPVPASPAVFANGAWAGAAFAPAAAHQAVWLLANAPSGIFSFSPRVLLSAPAALTASTGIVHAENFDSGVLGPAWSTAESSGATGRLRITTANVPKGKYHLAMDTSSSTPGVYARNLPTLSVNLEGKKNVTLDWRAKAFNDEGQAPVLSGPFGTFGSSADFDGIAISPDGVTWVEVAPLRGLPAAYPAAASRVFLDPIVQRMGWSYNASFRIRFSHHGDQAMNHDGIAIDDIVLRANPAAAVSLDLPGNIMEGTVGIPVTVTLPAPATSATKVTLTSNAPARLSVISPIIIQPGQTTATTVVSAPQNRFADIGRDVVITAAAKGFTSSVTHARVVDDERPVLSIALPPVGAQGSALGQVILTPAAAVPVIVYLSSSDSSRLAVTGPVTIPVGSDAAVFSVAAASEELWTDPQPIVITASAQGTLAASAQVEMAAEEVAAAEAAAEGGAGE